MKITFPQITLPKSGVAVLFYQGEAGFGDIGRELDEITGNHLSRAAKLSDFKGKKGDFLEIIAPNGCELSRIVVAGVGDAKDMSEYEAERLGGSIGAKLIDGAETKAQIVVEFTENPDLALSEIAARIGSGIRLRDYRFDKYKKKKDKSARKLKSIAICCAERAKAASAFRSLDAVASGVHLARDLVNEPPNILYPAEFAKRAAELKKAGLDVEILNEKDLKKLKMEALLGVGQGSVRDSCLAVMIWNGGKKGDKPVSFIGKGVTFDTGGISLKPGAGMGDMKGDMGGAACVVGLMKALAGRKAKVNAVGVIGLVENMPDAAAQRPGDVVNSMSGQTIEILNTDAEGRLVLADALWYTQDRFEPQFMVNLATLTGAILVALGKEYAGLFSNNDELAERLSEAGRATGEKVWRMPLDEEFDKLIDTPIADMKNIGGRNAGSITAAQFLQRFVNGCPWAHLDIAGTAMGSPKTPISQSWASGYGVRLLNKLVEQHYER